MTDNYKEMYSKGKHRKDPSKHPVAGEKSQESSGGKAGKNLNAGRK